VALERCIDVPEISPGSRASSAGSAWDAVTAGRDGPAGEDGAVATAEGSELEKAAEGEEAAAGEPPDAEPPAAFDGEFEELLPQPVRTRMIVALIATGKDTRRVALLLITPFIELLRSLV
jgi:hypothetical protein